MYVQIGLSLWKLQGNRDILYIKNSCKIAKLIDTIVYVHIKHVAKEETHDKFLARKKYLETSPRFVMSFFVKRVKDFYLKLFLQKKIYHRCFAWF